MESISVIIRGHGSVDCDNYTVTPENVNVTFPVRKSEALIDNRTISLIEQFKRRNSRLSSARNIRSMLPNTLIKNMNIMLKCFYQHNGRLYSEPINNNIGIFTYSGIINNTRSLYYMGELAQHNRLPKNIEIVVSGIGPGFIDEVTELCPDMTGFFYILYFGYSDYSATNNKKNPIFGIVNTKSYYCIFLNEIKNRSKYRSLYEKIRNDIAYSNKSWLKDFNISETSENVISILDNNMSNYINNTIYERIIDMSYTYHAYEIIPKKDLRKKNYMFTLGNIFNYIKIYNQKTTEYYPVDYCHVLTCRSIYDGSEAYNTRYLDVSASSRTCSTTNNRLTAPQLMRVESINNRYRHKFSNIWSTLRRLANSRHTTSNNRSTSGTSSLRNNRRNASENNGTSSSRNNRRNASENNGTTSLRNNRRASEINILTRIRAKYNNNGNLSATDFINISSILNRN